MEQTVSFLPSRKVSNPATHPELTDVLRASVAVKRANALELLHAIAERHDAASAAVTFANSFGAEDMVITDIIMTEHLPIEIFSLDTGRLPGETYTLISEVEQRYDTRLKIYFPESSTVEAYVRSHGINAFYNSVELRKACCGMRKVEPLRRALAGKKAWITGMRAAQSATRTELPVHEFDEAHGLDKYNPLADWSEQEVWAYIRIHGVPYNTLHDQFYPSIGCAPCTRSIAVGEDVRAGRWWWENPESKECGLHVK
ncbi:MAG: phosphoadenosine phosphosulfate reductase [Rhodocyclales bacterium]|nr:phosphoadenosine phosphosulfate reductase [Rhodocyclales bacterium]